LLHFVANRLQQADASAVRISVDVFTIEIHDKRSAIELAQGADGLAIVSSERARAFSETLAYAPARGFSEQRQRFLG
jgi:hypothetical protein